MKSLCGRSYKSVFRTAVVFVVLMILVSVPTLLLAQRDDDDSLVYPPDSIVYGMTYGDWVVAYWQYILSIPASTNPALDTTGAYCSVGQGNGPVFFLNASFSSGVLVTRTCTVPAAGKALWIPNVGNECSTVEPPPYHGDNPQELRQCTLAGTDAIVLNTVKFTVDGHRIRDVARFRVQGPYYDFVMPPNDNILGLPGVGAGSSVPDMYVLMLKPLSRGNHVIHFEGTFGPPYSLSFSVTYNLTIQ
jgi:hypothetical protein